MSTEFLVLLIIFCAGFGIIIYFITKKQTKQTDSALLEWLKTMQVTLDATNKNLHDSLQTNSVQMTKILQENARQLHERLDKAAEAVRDVNREVGKMNEIGRNMQELQEFLKSPKLRGNIGEHVLKDLISQSFPKNSFSLQYQFRSGEKVDAAIRTDAGILPIDAKFPMENFQKFVKAKTDTEKETYRKEFVRDVKKHIDTIAKKYVLPDEGTMDFALMYIPSESVFYEIANTDDVIDYARKQRVYIVSPTTLYAHLQTILLSFEGKKIEQQSRALFTLLRALQIDYGKVNESLETLGKHLNNASGQYSNVVKGFGLLGQKLESRKQLEEAETNTL